MKKLTKDEFLGLLYRIGFFKQFSPEEKYKVGDCQSFTESFLEGDYIIREGDEADAFYIMLKGKAFVTKNSLPRLKLAELKPGSVFGEISVLAQRPRTTNIIAATDTLVLRLNAELEQILGPELGCKIKDQLVKILILKLDRMNDTLMKLKKRVPEDEWPFF
ncbi:MAG: cyclic nucleotide-binding domain-containing protein [Nitrospinae bacterium]|nr:cyclic nucleotide-binding domain-containing protein [Nitrospinota bacterium]